MILYMPYLLEERSMMKSCPQYQKQWDPIKQLNRVRKKVIEIRKHSTQRLPTSQMFQYQSKVSGPDAIKQQKN